MTKLRLIALYKELEEMNYYPEYLNLEFKDIDMIVGVKINFRLSIEEKEMLKEKLGNLDFFELRAKDDEEYLITDIGRKIRVGFDGVFITDDGELDIKDNEELKIKDYGYIDDLDEWFK